MANDDARGEGSLNESWRRGIAGGAALIAAILLVSLVVLVAGSNRARDQASVRERHSYEVMLTSRALDAALARSEAALGRFVISSDKGTGSLYYEEWRRAGRLLQHLTSITRDNSEQALLVEQLSLMYQARGRELAAPASQSNYRRGWEAVSLFYKAGQTTSLQRITAILTRIIATERELLRQRSALAEASARRSNMLAGWLSILSALLVIGAVALGWAAIDALAQGRRARRDALAEAERAETLEQAVAERTRELREANISLQREAGEREAAEAQLRQVQKMEAVGQLTGGIAHDFNNMLAVVVGGLDLARRRLDQEAQEVGRHLDNAMEGANRAAALTRRLLAFARSEPISPEGIEPATLISAMSDLLDRALGERIAMRMVAAPDGWNVWCDPNQLENAVLNLAVNARDAMAGEGELTIETANVTLSDGEVGEARHGDYVRITVTDTGEGMSREIIERAFEPFFTTKPVGKGTGLGLSQIFGFARQSGGEVTITSALGQGTSVALYLPRSARSTESQPKMASPLIAAPSDAAGATILVVEDDQRVRTATVDALEELGYAPLPCHDGESALALLAERRDIRLVVTDVVMPGMTGPQLASEIRRRHPHLGILFVTGYVGDAGEGDALNGQDVLRKPFTIRALEQAVAAAFRRSPPSADQAA